ncbi:MAG: multicopper oxidase domain-containing protein [Betaproteobacteria bacterium]|nr:multicopper oxidase domain-containing protein [Betaproteobacteria bacterium]
MNQREKLIQRTMDVQREITQAGLKRRDLLKMGLLSAGTGMLLPIPGLSMRAAWAKSCPVPGEDIISPYTRPWVEELPRLTEKQTVLDNDPHNFDCGNGGDYPSPGIPVGTMTGGDSKFRLCEEYPEMHTMTPYSELEHQCWGKGGALGNFPPQKWYEMRVKQYNHVWHRDLPAGMAGQPAWGFDSQIPGPMFRTRYGEPHFVRIHNDLPATNLGFGINKITTHLHNMHTPSESDGNPLFTNYSGHYYDYCYPNVYAGVNQFGGIGNPDEALGTIWYHDHQLDFTAQNVYAGLFGMNSIYDAWGAYSNPSMGDYGDETKGWRLPCGENYEFDVGLVFHDRQFDPRGVDFFPLACFDGAIGDKMTVNGKIQPYMPVKRRKYRFRMLNGGPSRTYEWFLSNGAPFIVIANDGNLLPAPVLMRSVRQTVAERFDVIMDFSRYAPGTEIILINRAEQVDGRAPSGKLLSPGMQVLKFIVTSDSFGTDYSRIPAKLRPLPDIRQPISRSRTWKFDRENGEWAVNGQVFDRNVIAATIPEGTAEHWSIINGGGSWLHPVHIHYEEHRILSYNRKAPAPVDAGRKDVLRLETGAKAEIYMRFRDYKGIYPMHCHNVVHEDHAMMVMWKIV